MPMMRSAPLLEDTTSSSNISGLMFRYSSNEDLDEVAGIHPATRANVRRSNQVYASTPLSGAKVNLAKVGRWPSPVRAVSPYSLKKNLHNEMRQMMEKKIRDSLEFKQRPLRSNNINLNELMSSDEETEEPHHSTSLEITHNKVNDTDTLEEAVRIRRRFRATGSVVDGNKKKKLSTLTKTQMKEVHNKRKQKSLKKITPDWDDISVAEGSDHALSNLQSKLPMKTLHKKEVTFRLPNRSSAEEQEVLRTNVKRNRIRRSIDEDQGRRKEVADKNQIVTHAEVHSEDTEDEMVVTTNEDDNKTNESPPSERGKGTSQRNIRKAEEGNKTLVENPIKSNKKAAPKTRKRKAASENKPDPFQQSGSKTLQDHKSVTRKQKKMSPKEISRSSVRSRRMSGTDKEDDPIQSNDNETLQDHKRVTGKQKMMSPKEIRQNSVRSRRKSGTDNEDGVRRSQRKRVRPLEYWKGERIEYEVGIDNCCEMMGICAGNQTLNENLRRHKANRKHIVTDLLYRDEDIRRKLIQVSDRSKTQKYECFSTFRIESETVESDMSVLIGLEAPGMSAGIMSVEPATVKSDLVHDESNIVCFIMSGTVTVNIQNSKRTLKKNEIFFVPKGIHFSISNTSQNEAVIGYTMYE